MKNSYGALKEAGVIQAEARSAAIEECAQSLEAFASQFHMNTTTGNRIQDILRGEAAAMRAMK